MKSSRRCCKYQWGAERYIHVAGRQRRTGRMSAPSLGPIAGSLTGRTTVAVCWFCWGHGGRPCRRLPRRCGLTRPAACRGVVQGCRGRGCQAGVCACTGCPGPMERLLGGGLPALQTHAMPTSFPCFTPLPLYSPGRLPRLLHSLRRAAWARRARAQRPKQQAADSS